MSGPSLQTWPSGMGVRVSEDECYWKETFKCLYCEQCIGKHSCDPTTCESSTHRMRSGFSQCRMYANLLELRGVSYVDDALHRILPSRVEQLMVSHDPTNCALSRLIDTSECFKKYDPTCAGTTFWSQDCTLNLDSRLQPSGVASGPKHLPKDRCHDQPRGFQGTNGLRIPDSPPAARNLNTALRTHPVRLTPNSLYKSAASTTTRQCLQAPSTTLTRPRTPSSSSARRPLGTSSSSTTASTRSSCRR